MKVVLDERMMKWDASKWLSHTDLVKTVKAMYPKFSTFIKNCNENGYRQFALLSMLHIGNMIVVNDEKTLGIRFIDLQNAEKAKLYKKIYIHGIEIDKLNKPVPNNKPAYPIRTYAHLCDNRIIDEDDGLYVAFCNRIKTGPSTSYLEEVYHEYLRADNNWFFDDRIKDVERLRDITRDFTCEIPSEFIIPASEYYRKEVCE